jgi:hypothetical protein
MRECLTTTNLLYQAKKKEIYYPIYNIYILRHLQYILPIRFLKIFLSVNTKPGGAFPAEDLTFGGFFTSLPSQQQCLLLNLNLQGVYKHVTQHMLCNSHGVRAPRRCGRAGPGSRSIRPRLMAPECRHRHVFPPGIQEKDLGNFA